MNIVEFCFVFSATMGMVYSEICSNTYFELQKPEKNSFNLNHLKDHLPPSQSFKDKSNLFAVASDKNYIFFNFMDFVYKQKVEGHQIEDKCQPRSEKAQYSTNRPLACIPEKDLKKYCPNKKLCWVALASCNNVTISYIDVKNTKAGIRLLYGGGDDPSTKFLVEIKCCKEGDCIKPDGIASPLTLSMKDCAIDATHCVHISSPYGCSCDEREKLDAKLGKKEFHCDAVPKGLHGGVSTGTLLLIFFFIMVFLYLAIGIGYKYMDGKRGTDTIPHLEMWQDLGGLICDGFRYVISCGEYREGIQYDSIG